MKMGLLEIALTLCLSLGAVIWGVQIYHQKGTWFLAGWNTMRKEVKATYNEKAVCRSFNNVDGILCAGLAVIAAMVILSIALPALNPKKYRK